MSIAPAQVRVARPTDRLADVERLAEAGHDPVDAENPYWATVGALTYEDPDRWRVVLVPERVL